MNETITTHSETPASIPVEESQDPLLVFFGIGMVINLLLIAAYVVWARKQWKQTDKSRQ